MSSLEVPGGTDASPPSPHLIVFDAEAPRSADLVATLEAHGYRVSRADTLDEALQGLRQGSPALLIWANGSTATQSGRRAKAALRASSRELSIPLLDVLEGDPGPQELADWHDDADDWVIRSRAAAELPWRVARSLRLRLRLRARAAEASRSGQSMPINPRFFPLVVHDLRTPLNVIGLSLRMIEQAIPRGNADLDEDLRFVEENFKQIERMLAQLSDYYRLYEDGVVAVTPFSPERLLEELVEDRSGRGPGKPGPVRLDIQATCPAEAALDPVRARQALQYALINATASANGGGVRITVRGGPDRWVTEFGIDHPPPSSVKAVDLRPDSFERICGTAAERRGMDLAIAARISELFGGAARLDVVADRGTTIVLDWPARLPSG